MNWKLNRTHQCRKCPWLVSVDPYDIPNGYCEEKHQALKSTIAAPGEFNLTTLYAMACHESGIDDPQYCIGWLVNQLGPGNNIGLRLRMLSCENADKIRLRGAQHKNFKDTLP